MTYAKLFVPTEVSKELHKSVRMDMSKTFGGYTKYFACGGWVSDDNELIEETVIVYETYTDMSETDTYSIMYDMATDIFQNSSELAVMFVINHDSHFIQ